MDLVLEGGILQSRIQISVKLLEIFNILTLIWVRNLWKAH